MKNSVARSIEKESKGQTPFIPVFEPPDGAVCLGEEVAESARGVEEAQAGELFAVAFEGGGAALVHGVGEDRVEFRPEGVEAKGVDDLVDVLQRGVVHAAVAKGDRPRNQGVNVARRFC